MFLSRAMRAYGFALLSFVFFSSHDAIVKALGVRLSVVQIIFFSALLSLIGIGVYLRMANNRPSLMPRHPWLMSVRVGLVVTSLSCAFYAFTRLSLSEAYALLFITPLLITAWSVPLLGEHVGLRRWIAVVVGLGGVLVVLRPGIEALTLGHMAALASSLSISLAMIIVRKISADESRIIMVFYPYLASFLVMGAWLPAVYVPMVPLEIAALVTVGMLFFAAQFCAITAYQLAPSVALIAPVQYTQIIWASIFGAVFFHDSPDIWVIVGAAIIIGSGLFVMWRETKAK